MKLRQFLIDIDWSVSTNDFGTDFSKRTIQPVLDQSLAYWVLPTDRRLPLALLDWQLSEILACSLDELMLTPGIGQKKIMGLLDLLGRAANRNQKNNPFTDVGKQSDTE